MKYAMFIGDSYTVLDWTLWWVVCMFDACLTLLGKLLQL